MFFSFFPFSLLCLFLILGLLLEGNTGACGFVRPLLVVICFPLQFHISPTSMFSHVIMFLGENLITKCFMQKRIMAFGGFFLA